MLAWLGGKMGKCATHCFPSFLKVRMQYECWGRAFGTFFLPPEYFHGGGVKWKEMGAPCTQRTRLTISQPGLFFSVCVYVRACLPEALSTTPPPPATGYNIQQLLFLSNLKKKVIKYGQSSGS